MGGRPIRYSDLAIGNSSLTLRRSGKVIQNNRAYGRALSNLLGWLRENVHRHGARYYPDELVERATGRPLGTAPYLSYLNKKFGELYDLD